MNLDYLGEFSKIIKWLQAKETSRNWKSQGNGFSPEASRRNTVLLTLWFCTSDLQNYKRIHLCYKFLNLWSFVTTAVGNTVVLD